MSTYERQLEVYEHLVDRLQGRKLVIRTLDLGGDKLPMFLIPHHEANPNLGSRGLRFSLAQPELFTPQLRALLATGARGNLCILFPMVLGQSDLSDACQQIERLAEEMDLEKPPRLGAMIETPSALFSLQEILQQVDFVSIGTNDLTQYMLAADRDAADLVDDYSVFHPSVLRAIQQVIEACNEAGRELSVCGEAAGNASTACLLVGLGVRQLSISPLRAARVRYAIRNTRRSELADLAKEALAAESAAAVKALLQRFRCDAINPTESA